MSQIIDIIRCVVQQELARTRTSLLGVVTAIFAHEAKDDSNNYEASVRFKHEDWELTRIPIAVDHTGAASLPVVGDLVLVQFIDGDLNQPVITGRFYHEDNRPPLHKVGDVMFEQRYEENNSPKINQLRFGADGAIYLQHDVTKPEDNSDAKATIKIEPNGDVTISANKKVVIKLTNDSKLEITADDLPFDIKCKKLTVTGDAEITGKTTIGGDTTINAKLTVGTATKTTIDGSTITGS